MSTEITVYKITRPDLTTYEGYQWVVGETRTFPGTGVLCGPGYAYAYETPQLAVLLKPRHVDYDPYVLWLGRAVVGLRDTFKLGCTQLTLLHEIVVPEITLEQRIACALRCVMAVYAEPTWTTWAGKWLDGTDRSLSAIIRARDATNWNVLKAPVVMAAMSALWAVRAAEWAVSAEIHRSAKLAVDTHYFAADAMATAATAAQESGRPLDLAAIAETALLPWRP